MASYLKYVMLLKEAFAMFKLAHVPREQNARVDLLAKQNARAEVSYPRKPKSAQDHHRLCGAGAAGECLREQKKRAPIVDTRNVEGGQGKCL